MTAIAMGDLVGVICEMFINNNGMAGDNFEEKMSHLHQFFNQVRECKLSVSPQKSMHFMTEAVFGGAQVSKEGAKPDLMKFAAVTNWPHPPHLLNLTSFLGLTGWFHNLINNHAHITKPLTDLVHQLDILKEA